MSALLLLSWKVGERPFMDFLPSQTTEDLKQSAKTIARAVQAGREIEMYESSDSELKKVYPDVATGVQFEGKLVPK